MNYIALTQCENKKYCLVENLSLGFLLNVTVLLKSESRVQLILWGTITDLIIVVLVLCCLSLYLYHLLGMHHNTIWESRQTLFTWTPWEGGRSKREMRDEGQTFH